MSVNIPGSVATTMGHSLWSIFGRVGGARIESIAGSDVSSSLLDELLQIRLSEFRLKPSVDPAVDRAKFHGYFRRKGATVLVARDTSGTPVGFYGWYEECAVILGKRVIVLEPEYGFFRREGRGGFAVARAGLGMVLRGLRNEPLAPRFLVGSAYPASYIALDRILAGPRDLRSPRIEPLERAVLQWFLERHVGNAYDATLGSVNMPTLPNSRLPKSRQSREMFAAFEALVPNWRDGYALPVVVRISPSAFLRGATDAFFRKTPAR